MADKTRQIGGLWEKTGDAGTLYELKLFINNADKATYTPSSAGKAPENEGQGGETYPTALAPLLPAGTYIYEYEFKPIGDHWILTIWACNDDYDWGKKGNVAVSQDSKKNRSWANTHVFFPASWWGIIPWEQHDLYDATNPDAILKYDNSGVVKGRKDLVFADATAVNKLGAFDTEYDTAMPFLKASSGTTYPTLTEMPLSWVNQKIPTTKFTVTFYIANSLALSTYTTWRGVTGPIPTSLAPESGEAARKWRWVSVPGGHVIESARQSGSVSYDEVKRIMVAAPMNGSNKLYWNPARNGGEWSSWSGA